MAEYLDEIPAVKAVSLHDIYRVIAGHSYYHGDRILAALTCIAEGKEVNPVRPADVAPVVRCTDCKYHDDYGVHFCNRLGMDCPDDSDFSCSYGKPKNGVDSDAVD